jgi:hypothetical protein
LSELCVGDEEEDKDEEEIKMKKKIRNKLLNLVDPYK